MESFWENKSDLETEIFVKDLNVAKHARTFDRWKTTVDNEMIVLEKNSSGGTYL